MRHKYFYIGLLLLIILLPTGLFAQEEAPNEEQVQTEAQTEDAKAIEEKAKTRPRTTLGFGLNIAYTILSEEGEEAYQDLSDTGFNKQSFFSFGGRVPFSMTFKVVGPWWLGFGAYAMLSYQSAQAKMFEKFPEQGVQTLAYGRGAFDFALVFYNEFAVSRFFSINVAVGPSFTLSFSDQSRKTQNGKEIPDPFTTFVREDPLQYAFGMMVDIGVQIRFNYTVGIGIDSYLLMYFIPQKTAFDANTWNVKSTYAGALGASVSLLFFL